MTCVEQLIEKAADAEKSEDAQRFGQAALNAAHALQVMAMIEAAKKPEEEIAF